MPTSKSMRVRTLYVLIERSNPKAIVLTSALGIQIWIEKEPKLSHKRCSVCDTDNKGKVTYYPILGANLANKRERICINCVQSMIPLLPEIPIENQTAA
jgi:hypothetical protein